MTTTSTQVAAAYQVILQSAPPGGDTGAYATSVAAQINQGLLTFGNYESSLLGLDQTMYTTTAALVTIDAFYSASPTQSTLASVASATSGTAFTSAIELHNLGYSDANVWTVLGANWANDPNSNFNALYKGLADGSVNGYTTFIDAAYTRVFGTLPTAANRQNLLNDIPGLTTLLSGTGHPATPLQVMGGLMGYLLYAGQSSNTGVYAAAANGFLTTAATDEATSPGSSAPLYGPDILNQKFAPAPSGLVLSSSASVNTGAATATEGNTVTFHVVTTGSAFAGTVLNYTLAGVTAAEVVGGVLSGQVTVGSDGTANVGVTLVNAPGEGLSGSLQATFSGPSGSSITASMPLVETPEVISAAQIVAANNAAQSIIVSVPATGNETVAIQGTGGLTVSSFPPSPGIVITGNSNITLNDVDGAGNAVSVVGTGNETINISNGVSDNFTTGNGPTTINIGATFTGNINSGVSGSGPVNIVVTPGSGNTFNLNGHTFAGGAGTHNTLTINGAADFHVGNVSNIQSVVINGTATFSMAELQYLVNGVPTPVSISGTGGTAALIINDAARTPLNLTGQISGITSLTLENGASIIVGASDLTGVTSITTTTGGLITTTIAGAEEIIALGEATTPSYLISDTAANIVAASGTPAGAAALAASQGLTSVGVLTIAQAMVLDTLATSLHIPATYTVLDTPANIAAALDYNVDATTLVSNPNATIQYIGQATVAVAEQLQADGAVTHGAWSVTDTAAHVGNALLASALVPADLGGLTVSGGVTVAQANAITAAVLPVPVTLAGSFTVSDTLANLGALSAASLKFATSVSLSSAGNTGTAAQIIVLEKELGAKFTGGYNLSDTVADLLVNTAIAKGATNITVTGGPIGVAVASSIAALGNSGTTSFSLTDNAANLAGASKAVLTDAANHIVVSGVATVAQAAVIAPFTTGYAISDTVANVLAASPTTIANAAAIVITGSVTLAQAEALDALTGPLPSYSISDTTANLIAAITPTAPAVYAGSAAQAALNHATSVVTSDESTVAQAAAITGAAITHLGAYNITDTVANVVASAGSPVVTGAASVTATGSSTVAQAATLSGLMHLSGGYAVSDTLSNVAAEAASGGAGVALLQASTAPVVLTGTATVASASQLVAATTFTNWSGHYTLVDTAANLGGASAPVLADATTITVSDTVLNIAADHVFLAAHGNLWIVNDTAAAALIGGAVTSGAVQVIVNDGPVTAAIAHALVGVNHNSIYAVNDTAANLSGASLTANSDGVAAATHVNVLGSSTVAVITALEAVNSKATYLLLDTAANLSASSAAAVVGGATGVTVSGTATASQAAVILASNATANYAIQDATTAVQAASSATINGATAVILNDGNRAVVTVAELAHFGEAVGALNNWASAVPGVPGLGLVSFDVSDTMDHLATLTNLQLSDAGKVTAIAGGAAVTATQASAVIGANAAFSGSFTISDNYASLIANTAAVTAAAAVTVTDASITASQAAALAAIDPTAKYVVSDFASNLTNILNKSGVADAASVIVFGVSSVADVQAVEAVNAHVTSYNLIDTADALVAAPAALLTAATSVLITSSANVAQLTAIDLAVGRYERPLGGLNDTATAIVGASQAVLNGATSVTVTGTATAAQAAALETLTFNGGFSPVTYAVSDSAANIIANLPGLTNATAVTVTGTVTAAQAVTLNSATFNHGVSHVMYAVADTADNLLNPDYVAAWSSATGHATTVTVTDATVTVATAFSLHSDNAGVQYNIADTQDHIVAALGQTAGIAPTGIDLNAVLGAAQSVSIGGTTPLALTSFHGSYVVSGSVATLTALPATVINANGYIVVDTIANELAALGSFTATAKGYQIADTAADITAAAPSFVQGAIHVTVTDAGISYATLELGANSIASVNGGLANVTYSLSDTAAHLFSGASYLTGVGGATNVAVTTALTGAQSIYLLTNHTTGTNTFAIADTAANLFGANAVAGADVAAVAAATSVAVTGAINDAQAASLVATNTSGSNVYNVTDTAANLLSGTAVKAEVLGAKTVSLSAPTVSVAQATELTTALGAKLTGGYSLSDNAADLAGATASVLQGATAITETGPATVLQETTIQSLLGSHAIPAYAISDTLAAISGASQALLTGETLGFSTTGSANAAQGELLQGLTYGAGKTPITFSVTDTSANILSAANSAAITSANDLGVTVTDTISVQTAASIYALNTHDSYTLSDTSFNYELASNSVVSLATVATVTDTVNVATASLLQSIDPGANFTFAKVTDTLATLGNLANASLLSHATAVGETATDAPTMATVESFLASAAASKLVGGYHIADSAANLLTAYYDQDHHGQVTGATSVVVTGSASVAQAQVLEALSNVAHNTVVITDTLAAVEGANQGVLNLAASLNVIVNENNSGAQVFNDTALTNPSATLVFSHAAVGTAETINAPVAGVFNGLAGVDLLTLKLGDTLDLHNYGPLSVTTGTTLPAGAGNAVMIQGIVSNAGATFTESASGTSTMLVWQGAVTPTAAVILVGVTPAQEAIHLVGVATDATHINILHA